MKKTLCILLTLVALLALAGCGSGNAKPTGDLQTANDTTALIADLPAPADTDEPAEDDTEEPNNQLGLAQELPADFFAAFDMAITELGDEFWPTAEMWASIGLPALDYKDSTVSASAWNLGDSLIVTGWADNDTKLDDLEGILQQLRSAGIAMEPNTSAFANDNEYVGYYSYQGVSLKISVYTGVAELSIYIFAA